jgi:hypothetical protein
MCLRKHELEMVFRQNQIEEPFKIWFLNNHRLYKLQAVTAVFVRLVVCCWVSAHALDDRFDRS